nr:ERCC4 domain-containing protein [Ferrimicrobium acidiphilum]
MPIGANSQEARSEIYRLLPEDERYEDKNITGVADFIIQGGANEDNANSTILIEHKELADFFASIYDGRLWKELGEMRSHEAKTRYLILEGEFIYEASLKGKASSPYVPLMKYLREFHPDREMAFYKSVAAIPSFDCRFVHTKDAKATVSFIMNIYESLGKNKNRRPPPLRTGFKEDWPLEKQQQYFMEAVGQAMAEAIIEKGTIKQIFAIQMTREEARERLPKAYKNGRKIPDKHLNKVLDVLGFVEPAPVAPLQQLTQ